MRVVVLTGNQERHRWVARRIAEKYDVGLIVHEKKPTTYETIAKDSSVVIKHFGLNRFYENEFLFQGEKDNEIHPAIPTIELPRTTINSPNVVNYVNNEKPDLIFLYGASILSSNWFDILGGKIINMHLGLSPYFRGSGTNFWPFYFGQPEYVGVTIHVAVQEVDAGGIICQVRPKIAATDTLYDVNIKTLKIGLEVFLQSGFDYLAGARPIDQQSLCKKEKKVWKKKDLTADAIKTVWRNFGSGMVHKYLKDRQERNSHVPIIERSQN